MHLQMALVTSSELERLLFPVCEDRDADISLAAAIMLDDAEEVEAGAVAKAAAVAEASTEVGTKASL